MPSEVIESLTRSKKLNIYCIQYSIWFYTSKDIKLTLTWYFAMRTPTDVIPIKHMIVTLGKKNEATKFFNLRRKPAKLSA